MKEATVEGLVGAGMALACSSVVILGACKIFPRFNRSLSVSGRTALIVSDAALWRHGFVLWPGRFREGGGLVLACWGLHPPRERRCWHAGDRFVHAALAAAVAVACDAPAAAAGWRTIWSGLTTGCALLLLCYPRSRPRLVRSSCWRS